MPFSMAEARRVVSAVSRTRLRLANRLRDIRLFEDAAIAGDRGRPLADDHPSVQILFRMRDDYVKAARALVSATDDRTDMALRNLNLKQLTSMAAVTRELNTLAADASRDIQQSMEKAEARAQEAQQHAEKMELLRSKYGVSHDAEDIKKLAEELYVLEAEPQTADPGAEGPAPG
jgi:hypothetical protein